MTSDTTNITTRGHAPTGTTPIPPGATEFTSDQVAWAQGIPVEQLLDSAGLTEDQVSAWTIRKVPIAELRGNYDPAPYFVEEADYMFAMQAAIDCGEVEPPAFIRFDDGYEHADGAHRTILAIVRGDATITAYVADALAHAPRRHVA